MQPITTHLAMVILCLGLPRYETVPPQFLFEKPRHAAFHAGNQVARDDQDGEVRMLLWPRRGPEPAEFKIWFGSIRIFLKCGQRASRVLSIGPATCSSIA
jgi:hypothetical protein